jgi:hypothetical protein
MKRGNPGTLSGRGRAGQLNAPPDKRSYCRENQTARLRQDAADARRIFDTPRACRTRRSAKNALTF